MIYDYGVQVRGKNHFVWRLRGKSLWSKMRKEGQSCWRTGQKEGEAGECQGSGSWGAGPVSCACLWFLVSPEWRSKEAGKELSFASFTLYLVSSHKTLPLEAISKNTALERSILKQLQIRTYKGVSRRSKIFPKSEIRKHWLSSFHFCLQKSASPATAHLSNLPTVLPHFHIHFSQGIGKRWNSHFVPFTSKAGNFHLCQKHPRVSMRSARLETDGGWMLCSKHPPCCCPSIPASPSPTLETQHPQQIVTNVLQQGGEKHKIITLPLPL